MLPTSLSIIHTRSVKYREQIIQLWGECLPGTPEGRFDWLAEGNPAGPTVWFLAIDENNGSVVGTGTLMPKELIYNGKRIKGGIVGDLMVSPAARKQGIAQHIQKKIADSQDELEMRFLYVVPNEHSSKLLVKAGIDHLCLLKNYMLPVDFEYFFRKLGFKLAAKFFARFLQRLGDIFFFRASRNARCTINELEHFNEEIDNLWQSVKDVPDILTGSKSSTFLNWKYGKNPDSGFQVLQYRTSTGVLVGYMIFSVTDSKLHIFELVSIKNKYSVGMTSELRKFAKANQLVGIYFCTTPNNPVLKVLWWRGFFPIGGDLQLLCKGEIVTENHPWVFSGSDRNL